jgi:carboxypeptidase C (cathepsin A)
LHLGELGLRMERPYVSMRTIETWNWLLEDKMPNGGGYINVVPFLARAMRRNGDLRLFLASGYFDLATPFLGAENALSQDDIFNERLTHAIYDVGHMIFLHEPSKVRFLEDIRSFVLGGRPGESWCSVQTGA